jgi:hypothetical protein
VQHHRALFIGLIVGVVLVHSPLQVGPSTCSHTDKRTHTHAQTYILESVCFGAHGP